MKKEWKEMQNEPDQAMNTDEKEVTDINQESDSAPEQEKGGASEETPKKSAETRKEKREKKEKVKKEETEADMEEEKEEEESDPLNVLMDQLARVEAEKKDLEEKLIRLVAEFDNYKKRMSRDFDRQSEMIREKILVSILPVMDDLDRLLRHEEDNGDVSLEGIRLIRNNFQRILRGYGVKTFDSVGEAFDPEKHDAMMTRQSDENKVPTVVEEFEKGYMINDKVLRHARVVVSAAE